MRTELRVVIDIRRNRRWLVCQRLRHRRDFSRNGTASGTVSFSDSRHNNLERDKVLFVTTKKEKKSTELIFLY